MDDLISRQAAIDKLKSIITDREYTSITDEAKERMARKFFADIPSSVQPEIIRCKDCKYHAEFSSKCNKLNLTPMWPNDYCSYGERKEESGDENGSQPRLCSTCHWCLNDWNQEPCTICVHGSKWQDGR